MKSLLRVHSISRLIVAMGMVVVTAVTAAEAQISVIHEYLPFQKLSSPGAALNNAEIQSRAVGVRAAFPLGLKNGRTVITNEVFYQRRDFSYRGFPGANPAINVIHDLNYTFSLQHAYSEKWALLANVTPGLASDFEAALSIDDFNFQAVVAFIRMSSLRFSYGFGAVYSTQFGKPVPIPIIALNWNNGENVRWDSILPVSSEFWYAPTPKLDLGMVLGLNGNNYRGDPSTFGVSDPQLRYFSLTVGPSIGYKVGGVLRLNVEGGLLGVQKFNFYNGNTKQSSFSTKPSTFVRVGISIGA